MKLYILTEEQIREANHLLIVGEINDIIEVLTPIELPSGEEIRERAENSGGDDSLSPADEYENGAKWMKEQILNQNK